MRHLQDPKTQTSYVCSHSPIERKSQTCLGTSILNSGISSYSSCLDSDDSEGPWHNAAPRALDAARHTARPRTPWKYRNSVNCKSIVVLADLPSGGSRQAPDSARLGPTCSTSAPDQCAVRCSAQCHTLYKPPVAENVPRKSSSPISKI